MKNHIRTFINRDWNEVSQIYQQGLDTNFATFQTSCPTYAQWDTSHLDFCRYVYEQNSKVIGWVALTPVSSRCVYAGVAEVSIYIANEAKGKGIGTQLLQQTIVSSEENGIWTLQSNILQDNLASIALHKKCGFREVGYREKIAQDKFGIWRNTILMERRSNR
ncbi:N-acetyltransferase family protein [Oscillospiraceae bacterium PP1C4]